MSKRTGSDASSVSSKRIKDDLMRDEPVDTDEEVPEVEATDSASLISAAHSMAGDSSELVASKQPVNSLAQFMNHTPIDSFSNIFRAVMQSTGGSCGSSMETDQLRLLNEKLAPIRTDNVDEDFLAEISGKFDEEMSLVLPEKKGLNCWSILAALRSPSTVFDENDPNYSVIVSTHKNVMSIYDEASTYFAEDKPLPEKLEIDLHLAASKFFKCLLLTNNEMQMKHLRPILEGKNFVLFNTASKHLRHLIKSTFNFRLNENFDARQDLDRRNPLFKFDGWGVVLVRPKADKKFFEIQEDCAAYMSDIFRELCLQRIVEVDTKRAINDQVWFNIVSRKNVPVIQGLDNAKLKKIDKDLQLCHVTISDAFLQPSKTNNNQLFLVVVLYINYFLTTRG